MAHDARQRERRLFWIVTAIKNNYFVSKFTGAKTKYVNFGL